MIKYTKLILVLFSAIALFACSGGSSSDQGSSSTPSSVSTASIQGNAVKGPIDGAEVRLFYFNADGTKTEVVAQNAPVLTGPFGGYVFKVNPDDLRDVETPMVLRNTGGIMGGQPAPDLATVISDPSLLKEAGRMISRHMSTASSVASEMLEYRAQNNLEAPTLADAEDCISKVEQALDVDLDQDPSDTTQAVAMLNQSVDEDLDLFAAPENNDMVTEYVDYLVCNLSSSSGMLDDKMDDPNHPGEDIDASFEGFGHGRLNDKFPGGPSKFLHLMAAVDKASILADGTDAATIRLRLTNGRGHGVADGTQIDVAIIAGDGTLSDTSPATTHGRAQVTFKSTTAGDVIIEASYYDEETGKTFAQEITVQVIDTVENTAPVANAGADQNVQTGSVVTLDGTQSSDLNNDQLTYSWTLATPGGSAATLSDPNAIAPTFTADVDGTYIAELVVNDGTVDSTPDSVTITASSANAAPVAKAGPDQNVTTGAQVALNGSGSSDADNDPLTYAWTLMSKPNGSSSTLSSADQANPTFTADLDGDYVVQLVVNDGSVDSAPDSVTITASTANSAPVANAGPDQNVATGTQVTLNGSGSSDADNDPLTYAWTLVSTPSGSYAALTNADQANPTFTADVDGDYVVRLVVNDGNVNSNPDTVTITASTANSAPIAKAGADQNVATGAKVTLNGSGSSDADNDPLTYAWTMVSRPSGSSATLSNSNQVNPTFTADRDGSYVVRLVVNDGTVNSSPDTVTITAATANSAPVAKAGADQNVATGAKVTLNGSGSSDADGDSLTYTWTFVSRPSGSSATLTNANQVNPTFTADRDGSYVVRLVVNDGTVNSSPDTVTITAATANSAPVANAGPNQSVTSGSTVHLNGSGSSDADGDSLAYTWTFVSRPSGSSASLSNANQVYPSFTADVAGTYVIRLVVNDGTVNSSADTVSITATSGGGVNGQTLFNNNCSRCHSASSMTWLSATRLEGMLPHQGNTLSSLGGTAGTHAIANYLNNYNN